MGERISEYKSLFGISDSKGPLGKSKIVERIILKWLKK
jgi:hypothetical protein